MRSAITRNYNKTAESIKISGNKAFETGSKVAKGLGVAAAVADVGIGFTQDYSKGASQKKMMTNCGVNAAYALGGIGVSAAAGWTVSALALSGPVGWIVLGGSALLYIGFDLLTREKAKNMINSLD